MILTLKKIDAAVFILHMSIMRKNIKKGFKLNHGKSEGKELIKVYDEVKEALDRGMEPLEHEEEEMEIDFDEKQIEMIYSFSNWYIPELEKTLKKAGKINKEDQRQLYILKEIKEKTEQVINVAS